VSRSVGAGRILRDSRDRLGLSQSQLARVFHCPATTISRWERMDLIRYGAVTRIIYLAIVCLSHKPDALLIGAEIRKLNRRNERDEDDSAALRYVLNLYFKYFVDL
jgi:transcriptional regulator with XRE-family HTH domain